MVKPGFKDKIGIKSAHATILIMTFLTGCDRISGIETRAQLTGAVNIHCVDNALHAVEGVVFITFFMDHSNSYQILPHRGKIITNSYVWQYGPSQHAILQIHERAGDWDYNNGMMKMGKPYPAGDLDAYLPLMQRVNAKMEASCGLPISARGTIRRN